MNAEQKLVSSLKNQITGADFRIKKRRRQIQFDHRGRLKNNLGTLVSYDIYTTVQNWFVGIYVQTGNDGPRREQLGIVIIPIIITIDTKPNRVQYLTAEIHSPYRRKVHRNKFVFDNNKTLGIEGFCVRKMKAETAYLFPNLQ